MATSINLRRSSRPKKSQNYGQTSTYPDVEPSTPIEQWISKLDKETFPSKEYARVDNILVYCIFANKRKPDADRALRPTRAFLEDEVPINNVDAMDICHAWIQFAESSNDSPTVASELSKKIHSKFPHIFSGTHDEKILRHLLQRYHIMNYSGPKAICVEKVRFNKGSTSCGLKAAADIEPSVVILASCSSMSSDLVLDHPGVSIINSNTNQKGRLGPRLILGPFRFANHDCCPNCQIMPIPNTHAYALCTLRKITAGEPITVKYDKDGSYFSGERCECATCNPDVPPVSKKRPFNPLDFLPNPNRPKKRRGGDRAKRMRPRVPLECLGPRAVSSCSAPSPSFFMLSDEPPLPYA